MHGRVTVVEERYLGTTLAADATAGDGTLTVDDATDFDEAGQLQLTSSDGLTTEEISYTAIDEDANTITLDGTLANSYTADDGVDVFLFPLSLERWAVIIENDNPEDEEGLWARVPHSLYDKMPVGVRDLDAGEGETVDAGYVGEDLVVNDVTAQQPLVDGTYIDPSTLPPAVPSDGDPPSGSPTPDVKGGPGFITATWQEVANTDAVTYEVHISPSNGFTPDGSTLFAETPATSIVLDTLADHSTALVHGTTYYVKLVEFDADGAAAAGSQGSATPILLPSSGVTSDGAAPGSSPAATVRAGLGYLASYWTPVSNNDPVTYDVYISATNGFTPGTTADALTPVVSTMASSAILKTLVDGSALVDGTTYYVKILARDADGAAAVGTQGSGAPSKVNTADIAAAAVTATEIGTAAVTSGKLAAAAVTLGKIDTDAVDAAAIAASAVGTSELAALAVTAAKIAANTITASQIAAGTITATEIAANTITAAKIAAGTITTAEIEAGTILAANIAAGTITGANIAATTIAAANIVSNTITAGQIAADTITAVEIAANAITTSELAANAVTAAKIAANTITAGQIAAGTITATEIAANTITAAKIVAGTITATELAAGSVTATKISVTSLDAISANLGTITAGTINATATVNAGAISTGTLDADVVTVVNIGADSLSAGAVTADKLTAQMELASQIIAGDPTKQHVLIDSSGVVLYDQNNNRVVILPADSGQQPTFAGNVVTGGLTITGNALVQGLTNFMDKGSQLTLNDQFAASAVAPSLIFDYANGVYGVVPKSTNLGVKGLDYDASGTAVGGVPCFLTHELFSINNATPTWYLVERLVSDYSVSRTRSTALSPFSGTQLLSGPVRLGTSSGHPTIWFLVQDSSGNVQLRVIRQDDFSVNALATTTITQGFNSLSAGVALGTDGTNLLILSYGSGSNGAAKRIGRYSVSGTVPTFIDTFLLGGQLRTSNTTLAGVTGRDGNITTSGLADVASGDVGICEVYNASTHALSTADGGVWYPGACEPSNGISPGIGFGITWDGAHYWTSDHFQYIKFSDWVWTPGTGSDNWWVGFTWLASGVDTLGITSISNGSNALTTTVSVHGLNSGDEIFFTTTGSLPTGLVAGTHYFVRATGLTTTAFQVSTSRGAGAVTTSSAGSGTHTLNYVRETKTSPRASIKLNGANTSIGNGTSSMIAMRGRINVVTAPLPPAATDTRVYMLESTAAPVVTTLTQQVPSSHLSSTSSYTQVIDVNTSGTVYRAATSFVSGTSNIVANASGITAGWNIGGDGKFVVPRLTVAQRPASPAKGQIQWNEDTSVLEGYDGVGYSEIGGPANGLTLLRRRLFEAAGSAAIIQAVNFDQLLASASFSLSVTGNTRYYAIYWPGGTLTGMYYYIATSGGAYTDANARSGSALYSTDGSTLTRVRTVVSVLSEGTGIRKRVWTGGAATLAAGIYYVGWRFVFSAGTPTVAFAAAPNSIDNTALGSDVNNASTPSNWPLAFTQVDATQALPTSQLISGLTIPSAVAWVGLY